MKKLYTAAITSFLCCTAALSSCGNVAPFSEDSSNESSIIADENVTEPAEEYETSTNTDDTESSEVSEPTKEPNSETQDSGVSENPSGITLSYTTAELFVGQTKEYPVVNEDISEIWTSSDPNVATVDEIGNITAVGEGACIIQVVSASDNTFGAIVNVTVKCNEGIHVSDDVTYIDGILIANKSYSLPSSYNPGGLTSETSDAFQELSEGAANCGLNIYISSGFRSYEYQEQIYNNYVDIYGQETADTFSARPGHSEHQTGLAIDVNEISDAFIGTPEAIWLEEHCHEYGFIIRYPKGKQDITGYKYEPWHIRYVGKEFAAALKKSADEACDPTLTLEEYLNIDSVYSE